MDPTGSSGQEMEKWDPLFTEELRNKIGPIIERYFRSEVTGLEFLPATGAALVVSNHSGGMLPPDVMVLGSAYYGMFGYDRPLYTLGHDKVFVGPLTGWLTRAGVIHASRENASTALNSGAVVLVFPGGDYDAYRPTSADRVVDFNGRTGYVKAALESGVPIVPAVSIGAQESQFFITRGTGLANRLGLRRLRVDILPISIGFPFGLSVFLPPNLPLPTKIVTRVLKPIDVAKKFGHSPDIAVVDAHIRSVMQQALGELARARRFPVLG